MAKVKTIEVVCVRITPYKSGAECRFETPVKDYPYLEMEVDSTDLAKGFYPKIGKQYKLNITIEEA